MAKPVGASGPWWLGSCLLHALFLLRNSIDKYTTHMPLLPRVLGPDHPQRFSKLTTWPRASYGPPGYSARRWH